MAPILTIPSGESRACLDLMITEDISLEHDETFVLSVEPSGDDMSVVMVVGHDNTTITILNDDAVTLSLQQLDPVLESSDRFMVIPVLGPDDDLQREILVSITTTTVTGWLH